MTEPTNLEEYAEKFAKNQRVEGVGIGNVYVHMPCPFCAEPDFLVYELLETEEAMKKGGTCGGCARSLAATFTPMPGGGVRFVLEQTGGTDPPAWLKPAPPRRKEKVDA